MFFKNICILVLWPKVASALEGLNHIASLRIGKSGCRPAFESPPTIVNPQMWVKVDQLFLKSPSTITLTSNIKTEMAICEFKLLAVILPTKES